MLDRRSLIGGAFALPAAARAQPVGPVLVELFTSQGCSSCPPADEVLSTLARRDDVVALSFHVDYWDKIGWKDPFASAANTRRQRDYAAVFHHSSVYTPQMVFDGVVEGAAQSDAAALRLMARLDRGRDGVARVALARSPLAVEISVTGHLEDAEIWAAAFTPAAITDVRRGENAGRKLTNVNIVRILKTFGAPDKSMVHLQWGGLDPALGLAVWVQDKGLGPVRAAAMIGAPSESAA